MFYVSMKAHDNQKIPIENTKKRISIKTYHYKKINETQRRKVKKTRTKELHDIQKTIDKW